MTLRDNLVKRLRRIAHIPGTVICAEAADDIERLRAELAILTKSGIAEVAVRNPNVMEYMKHWEGRAEKAEAEIARLSARAPDMAVALIEAARILENRPHKDDCLCFGCRQMRAALSRIREVMK